MSIASRIEQIEQHLTDDYSVLTLAGADLTNVDKNIQNLKQSWEERLLYFLANGTDVVWNNWLPKVTGSGTEISLNNTIEAKMDFVYKGNTYQYSTTGKNLFDNVYGQTGNVYKKHIGASSPLGSVDCYPINLLPNTQYTLKIDMNGYKKTSTWIAGVCFENGDVISLLQFNTMADITTTTFTTDSTGVVYVGHRYGFTYGETGRMDLFLQAAKIQLEKGSTATDYEPYTGNQPAPNPDYPQDIQVVSGDNTIKVEGKNLLDTKVFENRLINCYVVNSNGTITQTATDTNFWQSSYMPNSIILNSGTYTISVGNRNGSKLQVYNLTTNSNIVEASVDSYTFTLNNDNQVINAKLYGASSYPFTFTMQLEKGSTATTYEPYQSQTYPINIGNIELCKIGDYQDSIKKSTGKNLFDKDTIEEKNIDITTGAITDNNYWRLSDYISVIPSTNYMSSMINHTSNQFYVKVAYYDNTKTFISGVSSGFTNNQYYGFTTPNNAKYIRFAYIVIISETPQNIDNIMINEGTTALPYEPYGKVWYLNKQIGKITYDGTEDWGLSNNVFYKSNSTILQQGNIKSAKSNYFQEAYNQASTTNVNTYNPDNSICGSTAGTNRFYIKCTSITSTDNFKTWLSTHNLIVYYVLATPTTTEITNTTLLSQLEAIKKSYNTQTSISQVNNDLPFELDVVALGELEI